MMVLEWDVSLPLLNFFIYPKKIDGTFFFIILILLSPTYEKISLTFVLILLQNMALL